MPGWSPGSASRSDVNAIHAPSGDQRGRKLPDGWSVRFEAVFEARSSSQMSAVPRARVETNARVRPSGERAP